MSYVDFPGIPYLDRPEDPEPNDCVTCVYWWLIERRDGEPVRGECRIGEMP